MCIKDWPIVAPSWVFSGTVAENARFLADKVREIDICAYFTEATLAWTENDLPPDLVELPVSWHVHLPVDLPWKQGGAAAARAARAVWNKVAYLSPRFGVLHIPSGPSDQASAWLREFVLQWREDGLPSHLLLLENVRKAPLAEQEDVIVSMDTRVCLDVAHAMSFGHQAVLEHPRILERIELVHWSSPLDDDRHKALDTWTPERLAFAHRAAALLPKNCTHVLEMFQWDDFVCSIPILQGILKEHALA